MVPTSAVQRGPAGTFSYVIGPDNIATAKPVVVTQQNENDAVIASGLSTSDRVVTTGFANLSDGAKGSDRHRRSGADRRPRAAQAQPQPGCQGRCQGWRPRAEDGKRSAARAIRRDKPDRHRRAIGRRAKCSLTA